MINTGWLVADRIFRLATALVSSVLLARSLGPAEFGTLQYVFSFVVMFGMAASLGTEPILVREIVRRPSEAGSLIGTVIGLRMVTAVVIVMMMVIICHFSDQEQDLIVMIAIAGLGILLQPIQTLEQFFQAHVAASKSAAVYMFGAMFGGLWVVFGVLRDAPLLFFAAQPVMEGVFIGIGLFIAFRTFFPYRTTLHFEKQLITQLMRECWPLTLSLLMIGVYTNVDKIMIRELLGNEATGIYAAASKLSEAFYFIPMVIVNSLFPAIVRARELSTEHYKRRLQDLYDLMVWISIAIALPVSLIAEWIVVFLYGQEYLYAGAVLSLHVWTAVLVFLGVASGRWFILEGHTGAYMGRTLVGVVSNIVLNLLLIPTLGILGAAWATLIAQVMAVLVFDLASKCSRENFWMKCRALWLPRRFVAYFGWKHGQLPRL